MSTVHDIIVYPKRFLILFIFSLASFNQALFWLTFSPIANVSMQYFNISLFDVDLLLNWGPIVYVPLLPITMYLCNKKEGVRSGMLLCTTATAVAMVLRCIPRNQSTVAFLHIAQIVNAACGPYVMANVTLLTSLWFPVTERARATSVAVLSNFLGNAAGFISAPYVVKAAGDMVTLLYSHAALSILSLLLSYVYFDAAPPTPPSVSASSRDDSVTITFKASVTMIWSESIKCFQNPSFLLLAFLGGGVTGIFNDYTGLLDTTLEPLQFSPEEAGIFGCIMTIAFIVGGILIGYVADTERYSRKLKELIVISTFAATLSCLVVVISLPSVFFSEPLIPLHAKWFVGTALSLFGFFVGMILVLIYELGAELMYPVSELYSGGIITFWNALGGILILVTAPFVSPEVVNVFMLSSISLCCILFLFMRQRYHRRDLDVSDRMDIRSDSEGDSAMKYRTLEE